MKKEEAIKILQKELRLKRYATSTIDTYTACLVSLFNHFKNHKSQITLDDLKDYLLTIKTQSYHKQMVATIHHFYKLVLKRPIKLEDLPYPRPTHYLPQILSVQEIHRMMARISNLKHRCILQLMYSCALRVSEPTRIDVAYIDFDRQVLFVKAAKGFKDRIVPIPSETLSLLFTYINTYRVKKRLFEGQGGDYTTRSIQQIFHRAVKAANIYKSVTSHCLRHSRATHLCDAKVDIYKVKEFLGHYDIKTTEKYLHLSKLSLCDHIAEADKILANTLIKQLEAA